MAASRATDARRKADVMACDTWTKRMLPFRGPAQPSPMLGNALNAGFQFLEVFRRRLRSAFHAGFNNNPTAEKDDAGS
jgi:hypothetical protein